MKKWIVLLLLTAMLLSLTACMNKPHGEAPTTELSENPDATGGTTEGEPQSEDTTVPTDVTEAPTETEGESAQEELFWAEENVEYPMAFYFSSGAGAWGTELWLNEDGSFTGYFHDSNMGETGDGYAHGTVYECSFAGKFSPAERLDMYTYGMKLEELTLDRPAGEEWIDEEIRYISSDPYGLEGGEDFQIYLPNTPTTLLSEDAYMWWPGRYGENPSETLRAYCLRNVANDQCFFSELSEVIEFPMDFYFSSGAGAWGTELWLNEDGTFTGNFHDTNMGETGEGHPYGTTYTCSFSGKFGSSEKLDDYSYSVKLEELTLDRPAGEEWIEGEMRYISASPYGLEGGEDFIFYLPDTPITMLSEDELFWWPGKYQGEYNTLHGYAIYNAADDSGFFSMIDE